MLVTFPRKISENLLLVRLRHGCLNSRFGEEGGNLYYLPVYTCALALLFSEGWQHFWSVLSCHSQGIVVSLWFSQAITTIAPNLRSEFCCVCHLTCQLSDIETHQHLDKLQCCNLSFLCSFLHTEENWDEATAFPKMCWAELGSKNVTKSTILYVAFPCLGFHLVAIDF